MDDQHDHSEGPPADEDDHVATLRRELAASRSAHVCRRNFGEDCRCEAFSNWVVAQAHRLLADERAEVRRHGERLLRSVVEGLTGRRMAGAEKP
ncbi:MAG: hypothetical protein ACM30I_04350 [Gemmatimonas sp.]